MARNRQASFAKRKKEQLRQEKTAQKRARRSARADDRATGNSTFGRIDHDAGVDKPTDDEVQRAIEHAMNPGKRRKAIQGESTPTAKLFIGNVDHEVNEGEITELFKEAGFDVVTTRIGRDRATGESRGFAFIELASDRQAVEATMKLQGTMLSSRELRIQAADRRPSR
jgi:hypothetical protein